MVEGDKLRANNRFKRLSVQLGRIQRAKQAGHPNICEGKKKGAPIILGKMLTPFVVSMLLFRSDFVVILSDSVDSGGVKCSIRKEPSSFASVRNVILPSVPWSSPWATSEMITNDSKDR